ncbi:hypothetical protein OB955_13360 [Halobacteria archaeon AArc-m2/3/4]|uniref:Uncharacterized protein n=1 Tax=Natronoglomus mannanivorans TaxID=2979990 RepID=A0AAP2YY51_9EURY|nr:hypothetical protein [Halobacteria archaeon AArc-xg1-1]MCU4973723.1 hypothetical protein [Halobacteria archaeon AArc-m2/3/4]
MLTVDRHDVLVVVFASGIGNLGATLTSVHYDTPWPGLAAGVLVSAYGGARMVARYRERDDASAADETGR